LSNPRVVVGERRELGGHEMVPGHAPDRRQNAPPPPGLNRRVLPHARQQAGGCLEQVGSHQVIAPPGDATRSVDLARLVSRRGEPEVGAASVLAHTANGGEVYPVAVREAML
jgi:hypothetical protein